MKNEKIVLNLNNSDCYVNDYIVAECADVEKMKEWGNSERFAGVIAGHLLIVNGGARIHSSVNPHIEKALKDAGVDGWRIDGAAFVLKNRKRLDSIVQHAGVYEITKNKAGEIIVKRKKQKGEKYCKTCGAIIDGSNAEVGAHCLACLFGRNEGQALARRYDYHGYSGGYDIKGKADPARVVVMGAEIERDYTGGLGGYDYEEDREDAFEDDLQAGTLAAVRALYGEDLKKPNTKRRAVFMSDGSLDFGGVEWITFPQTFAAYKGQENALRKTFDAFRNYSFEGSCQAGTHIHIDRRYFGDIETKYPSQYAAAKLALIFCRFWSEFKLIARRTSTGYTNKPDLEDGAHVLQYINYMQNNTYEHSLVVNQQHARTIEIRMWGACEDEQDLLFFLDLTQALARFVKRSSIEKCEKVAFVDLWKGLAEKSKHLAEIARRLGSASAYTGVFNQLITKAAKAESKRKEGKR